MLLMESLTENLIIKYFMYYSSNFILTRECFIKKFKRINTQIFYKIIHGFKHHRKTIEMFTTSIHFSLSCLRYLIYFTYFSVCFFLPGTFIFSGEGKLGGIRDLRGNERFSENSWSVMSCR